MSRPANPDDADDRVSGVSVPRWRRLELWALLLLGCLALLTRLALARLTQHPGHADEAFYYVVARNLADGRGLVIDYVWHYLAPPPTVTHPSYDYWLPLPSAFISIPIRLFGPSLFLAQLPGIAAGLTLAGVAYFVGRAVSRSTLTAFGAAVFALFEPNLLAASVGTSSVIYFALFGSLALALMAAGREKPRLFVLAAFSAGLASLARQDGFLLAPVLVFAILSSPGGRKTRIAWAGGALALYALTLTPMLALNHAAFGSVLAPGREKLPFFREFEDLYAYSDKSTLSTYLAWGPRNIVLSKMGAGWVNLAGVGDFLGWLWIVILADLALVFGRATHRELRASLAPALIYLTVLFGFHTGVTTYTAGGGFINSAHALIPFALVALADAVRRHVRRPRLALLVIGLLTAYFATHAVTKTREYMAERNGLARPLAEVKALVERDGPAHLDGVVVMTRVPWELNYSTGYKAVQIPNDDLPTILEVARRYKANYLLLPAPRPALVGLYQNRDADARFRLVGEVPHSSPLLGWTSPLRLYRIDLGASSPSR
jgi:4-amino-4-deoxy-L-arabinose transferase-like glycosyltransferase